MAESDPAPPAAPEATPPPWTPPAVSGSLWAPIRLKVESVAEGVETPTRLELSDAAPWRDCESLPPVADDWTANTIVESTPLAVPAKTAPSARRPVLLLLLAVTVVASIRIWTPNVLETKAAAAFRLLFATEIPVTRTSAGPAPLVGQLDVTSAPSGVDVMVDGEPQGVTPVQLVLNAGRHELTFVSPLGKVRRAVRIRPGYRTLFSEAIFSGSLVVTSKDKVAVRVGRRVVGTTSGSSGDQEIALPPGMHVVNLTNPNTGEQSAHPVEILPGTVVRLDADATPGP